MNTTTHTLPINSTIEPADQQALIEAVREAYESETPIYPIGGGTSLGFGLPAKQDGIGVSLTRLNRVIDYPARDMTITVEAGITMKELANTLLAEDQRLPVDVPESDRATLGGVIATNWNGPRRYGLGNLRDYVIGITAVDGRGREFKGGGRVVKNVAGYDFCKLLTGSLGTLGIISQVTLKLKPTVAAFTLMKCEVAGLDRAEQMLGQLAHSETTPSAIELLAGPAWLDDETDKMSLVVALEGTQPEVEWMEQQLASEWQQQGTVNTHILRDESADELWQRLVEFPAGDSPLVVKANVVPSGTTKMLEAARAIHPNCSIQAHAGNGVVIVRLSEFPADGLTRTLVGRLQPVAHALHGNVVVLSNPGGAEMTHQCVWGGIDTPFGLMTQVKSKFDPKGLLNPGRFVYT